MKKSSERTVVQPELQTRRARYAPSHAEHARFHTNSTCLEQQQEQAPTQARRLSNLSARPIKQTRFICSEVKGGELQANCEA